MADLTIHEVEDRDGKVVHQFVGEGQEKASATLARNRKAKLVKRVYGLESEQVIEDFRDKK